MKTAMPAGLMSSLQSHAPSLTSPVKMKLKPGDSKLMSNQINRTIPTHAAPPIQVEKDPFGKFGSMNWADSMGREMARSDMEKAAHAQQVEATAVAAGAALVKMAGLGAAAMGLAKAHPGATIGAALGLAHGALKNGGGLGSALTEGAMGAGVGAGAQHGIKAVKAHPELGRDLQGVKDRVMAHMTDRVLGTGAAAPSVGKVALAAMNDELHKIAFGGLASIAKAAVPAITSFVKNNPFKAGMGAVSAVSNFASARKNGEGLGSALLSGGMGAASAV